MIRGGRKTFRASAVIVVVVAAAGLGAFGTGRAHGIAPNSLQVYNAQSIATPLGVVLRVPAESDGGVDYAETDLDLTKARAVAGGFTAGALGDAFLQTSLPNYTNPTLVVAENPPTAVFPTEAAAPLGAATPAGRAANFHAVATATPSATADAEGGTLDFANLVHFGGAVSRTVSQIEADGTVATKATSSVENLTLGPTLLPVVSIAHMTSTAEVRVPPGQTPQTSFRMTIAGALIGGVPVQITDQGVTVGGALAVPPSGVAAVNQALARLQALGITIVSVPVTTDASGIGATIQGGALQLRTRVPANVALPTDIGKDNTILLGEVRASALARQRQPLALPGPTLGNTPPSEPDLSVPTQDLTGGLPASAPSPLSSATLAAPATASLPQTGSTSLGGFNFAARARHTPASAFLSAYRMFLLAALAGLGAFLVRQRTRLTE